MALLFGTFLTLLSSSFAECEFNLVTQSLIFRYSNVVDD